MMKVVIAKRAILQNQLALDRFSAELKKTATLTSEES
jgi:hypothetical protein